jgi:hypothetical protein
LSSATALIGVFDHAAVGPGTSAPSVPQWQVSSLVATGMDLKASGGFSLPPAFPGNRFLFQDVLASSDSDRADQPGWTGQNRESFQPADVFQPSFAPPASVIIAPPPPNRSDTVGLVLAHAAANALATGNTTGLQSLNASPTVPGGLLQGVGKDLPAEDSQLVNIGSAPAAPVAGLDAAAPDQRTSVLVSTSGYVSWTGTSASTRSSGQEIAAVKPPGLQAHGSRSTREPATVEVLDRNESFPTPTGADLLGAMIPFDGSALEQAVDQFLGSLDEVKVDGLAAHGRGRLYWFALSILSAAAFLEIARRRLARTAFRIRGLRQSGLDSHAALTGGVVGFPELPTFWSKRRS